VRETRGVQQAAGERERTAGAYRTGQCFLLFCYYSIHSLNFFVLSDTLFIFRGNVYGANTPIQLLNTRL
jgi:hypothetical protein